MYICVLSCFVRDQFSLGSKVFVYTVKYKYQALSQIQSVSLHSVCEIKSQSEIKYLFLYKNCWTGIISGCTNN